MEGEGRVRMMRKAEIDSSVPYRSVKEAVLLFGEKVLATEVYANKIQQMQSDDEQVKAELEETKESLQKAREQSMEMASCLSSLQEELARTRRELEHLKEQEKSSPSSSSSFDIFNKQHVRTIEALSGELEHLKFMEDSTQFDDAVMMDNHEVLKDKVEFHKKRYVTFGNFPTPFGRVIVPPHDDNDHHAAVLQRHPSLRKKKKKSLIPFIGGIFSRKKGTSSEMV